ncbi:putative pentatricopeptide repeat-containing protein [Hordeum vulgare]|nr:putative pentatricopeptide repeat-containing protein [Hordeum vulgare]
MKWDLMASDAAGEGEKSSVEYSFMQAGGAGCPWRLAPPPPPPLQRPPPPRCRPPRPPAGLPGYAARGLRARPLHLSLRPQGARPGTRRGATACRRRPSVPRRLHAQLAKSGHGADVYVTSTLVHAYAAAAADAASARAVFDAARNRNVVTWTAMIAGHAAAGEARDAVALFREAVASGQEVINSVTVAQVMTACAQCGDMDSGRCGGLSVAIEVFDAIPQRNEVSWKAMVEVCNRHGRSDKVLEAFAAIHSAGMKPDKVTWLSILRACTSKGLFS